MSIRDVIRECRDAGELTLLVPVLADSPRMREVFVTHHVKRFLDVAAGTPRNLIKKATDARVALDRFTAGAIISVAMDPFDKPASTELARVSAEADGTWAFRIRDPKPQVRIFGSFAERDLFIALDYRQRDALDFEAAAGKARVLWDDLFGGIPPITGNKIDDYLSGYVRA